jgi:HEAT repeat protein
MLSILTQISMEVNDAGKTGYSGRTMDSAVRFRLTVLLAVVASSITVSGQPLPSRIISKDPAIRQTALRQLAAFTPEQKLEYLPELTRLIGGENGYVVALAFVKIGPAAVPHLKSLLTTPMRSHVARALAMIRPVSPDTLESIRKLLDDSNVYIRGTAAACVLSLGVEDERARSISSASEEGQPAGRPIAGGIPLWIQALVSKDYAVQRDARILLKSAGAAAIPPLLDALKSGDARLRFGAAEALALVFLKSYRPDVEAAMIPLLKDTTYGMRDFARQILTYQVSEAAADALIEDEVAEQLRRKAAEESTRVWLKSAHTREELLMPIPSEPDRESVLDVAEPEEASAPDGTTILAVLHRNANKDNPYQLLRVWLRNGVRYTFLKQLAANDDDRSYLSSEFFRFGGKLYLHLMTLHDGFANMHEDEIFRIERNALTPIRVARNSPIRYQKGEVINRGGVQTFHDDDLRFEFGIWGARDPSCCPSAMIVGTYTIVGNELRVATWKRVVEE